MKVDIIRSDQINSESHFSLILESLAYSPFHNVKNAEVEINSHLKKIFSRPERYLMIIAKDENTSILLGQLLVELDFGDIGLIRTWQPIVHPNTNRNEVATALIEKSKDILKSYTRSKMEIWMELANDHAKSMSSTYIGWYERCGFQLTSTEYNMEASYAELCAIPYSLPEQIDIATMNSVPIEVLRDAVFDAFKDSKDQWVKNHTEEEIRSIIQSWMKVEEALHPEASIVFMKNQNIIGFNGMQIQKDSVEVGPLGVVPYHRGKGLGLKLLLESIKRFQVEEIKKVILSVSTKNQPAINIYSKLGFQTQFQTLIYSWSP